MAARESRGRDWVAVVLAIGVALAINLITFGVLWDAIVNPGQAGLSENATQVLTAGFGGITGILGGYIGFRAGAGSSRTKGNGRHTMSTDTPTEKAQDPDDTSS